MLKIKRPAGLSNNPLNILPYLPDEEGFFDSRHWTFGGINEALPFFCDDSHISQQPTILESTWEKQLEVFASQRCCGGGK